MLPRTLFGEDAADPERLLDLCDVRQNRCFRTHSLLTRCQRGRCAAATTKRAWPTFRPCQRLHPSQVEERELIDQAVLALPYTAPKGHAAQNETGSFKLLRDRAQVAARQSTVFDEFRPREARSLGGERFDDLQITRNPDMADYARPLFRHKFSKMQDMAGYEGCQFAPY